jgi:hypothetical protein
MTSAARQIRRIFRYVLSAVFPYKMLHVIGAKKDKKKTQCDEDNHFCFSSSVCGDERTLCAEDHVSCFCFPRPLTARTGKSGEFVAPQKSSLRKHPHSKTKPQNGLFSC